MEGMVFKTSKDDKREKKLKSKIAVQIYAPYTEKIKDILDQLSYIPYKYDLFIQTNSKQNREILEEELKKYNYTNKKYIDISSDVKNNMYSFFKQMKKYHSKYKYILHLYLTEKKNSMIYNEYSSKSIYNLLGTTENIESIFYQFENNKKLGIVYSEIYMKDKQNINNEKVKEIVSRIYPKCNIDQYDILNFPGDIFWVRTSSIKNIWNYIKKSDFDNDSDNSISIEKVMNIVSDQNGYLNLRNINNTDSNIQEIDVNSSEANEYTYKLHITEMQHEIEKLKKEKKEYQETATVFRSELDNILESKSWKITNPLRKLSEIKNKIRPRTSQDKKTIRLLDNTKKEESEIYESTYQSDIDFSKFQTELKTIAFYLPQYHTFPENDKWWGTGFMEWTNTRKATPRFPGHYQPRVPHKDIGYYQLDNEETIRKQVELAKRHGLYGFAFYYYWFSGKRLMEKPLDIFLNSDIDFPFCLYWANENWTRTWDGLEKEVLIKQEYKEDEYKRFILDLKKYMLDPRYIKIDNKPVIMVYRPNVIPNFKKLVTNWKEYARKCGIGEIYVIATTTLQDQIPDYIDVIDAENDFAPHGLGTFSKEKPFIDTPYVFNYKKIIEDSEMLYRNQLHIKPFFYSCTMGWDNSARKKKEYAIYYNYSLKNYYQWLRIIIEETRKRNSEDMRFIFINAWNEWAEGTYLEPDEKYGYANINTLSKAIYDLPLDYLSTKKREK